MLARDRELGGIAGQLIEVLGTPGDHGGTRGVDGTLIELHGDPCLRVLRPVERNIDRPVDLLLVFHGTIVPIRDCDLPAG